jgi:hypothetical protein
MKFGGGDQNVYRYCGNAPSEGSDPLGLWTFGIGISFDIQIGQYHFGASCEGTIGHGQNGWSWGFGGNYGSQTEGFGLGVGAGLSATSTDAEYVDDLNGGSDIDGGFFVGPAGISHFTNLPGNPAYQGTTVTFQPPGLSILGVYKGKTNSVYANWGAKRRFVRAPGPNVFWVPVDLFKIT